MIVAIIQVRYRATRLPGKILMDVGGEPMLLRTIHRAREIHGVDLVACALASEPETPQLAELLHGHGVPFMVGACEPEDVLSRFEQAATHFAATTIVRVTPDCPLLDPSLSGLVLDLYRRAGVAYASNVGPQTDGADTEVFSRALLASAHHRAVTRYEREHVTPWMRGAPGIRRLHLDIPQFSEKLSVDTDEDLARVRDILRRRHAAQG